MAVSEMIEKKCLLLLSPMPHREHFAKFVATVDSVSCIKEHLLKTPWKMRFEIAFKPFAENAFLKEILSYWTVVIFR